MTQEKTLPPFLVAAAMIAISHAFLIPANAAFVVYEEDFDTFTTGTINGQAGWSASPASNDGVNISDLGAGDLAVQGDASGASSTREASNGSAYSLSTDVAQIMFEGRLRMRGGFGNRIWFTDNAGTQILGFGAGFGGHNFVVLSDPSDATKLFSGNITGDNALEVDTHRWFDTRFTVDFNDQLDATGTYEVRKDGQAGFSTVVGGLDLSLATGYEDPAQWSGLLLQLRRNSDQQDDFRLTATAVPIPPTFALLAVGLLALRHGLRRRGCARRQGASA